MQRFIGGLLWGLVFCIPVFARPLIPEQVPKPLTPWINWVLYEHQDYQCPFIYNSYQQKRCAWPSQLEMQLQNHNGQFTIHWQVFSQSWITLPGSTQHWPQKVLVNNQKRPVVEKHGLPMLQLTAGNYQIKGTFRWDYVPEYLTLPKDTGLINLTVNGQLIRNPAVRKGQIWLKESETGSKKPLNEENKLDLQVFRKIIDDVPMQIVTQFELNVSGDPRELTLPYPLLKNFIPLKLQSPLPARLEPDGSLLLQVRPGHWQIQLLARHVSELQQLPFNKQQQQWPAAEIWVFAARPYQRVVEIENLTAIDPSQTNLPAAWKNLPAYRIQQGEVMRLKTIRRGDPQPEPNQLNLKRTFWLDFDGGGYTVNDHIIGSMTQGWRLETLPEMQLGRVGINGVNQLVTRLGGKHNQGVEVRKGQIQLAADSRINTAISNISAVGWAQDFNQVRAQLNLPPGWRLLAASGIDNVPDSWISRWTLLDLFLVLITALAITRLWNIFWGLLALITLVIIWHETDAPQFIWLNIIAATALYRVLDSGIFKTLISGYRNLSCVLLVLLVVPFMISQVRIGLYPQLEKPWQIIQPQYQTQQAESNVAELASEPIRTEADAMLKSASKLRALRKQEPPIEFYSHSQAQRYDRIDPDANIQTGPGLPQWQWSSVALIWNGSVDQQQQIHFWYLTPLLSMLLCFARVLLLAVLTLLMLNSVRRFATLKQTMPALLYLLFLPLFSLPVQKAEAAFPKQEILTELSNRLLAAPECLPACAQIPAMHLTIDDRQIHIKLQIDALQSVAVPLPGHARQWLPQQVLLDGQPATALYRGKSGHLWINLDKGQHQVTLRGALPFRNRFTLPLPLLPHWLEVKQNGWLVEGLHEQGKADKQLQFQRLRVEGQAASHKPLLEAEALPPFVSVQRTLILGLDWHVATRILRVSPAASAIVLSVPLLAGESVTTPGRHVKEGKMLVNIPAGQKQFQWDSLLQKTPNIKLTAAKTEQWAEVWRVDVSPIWHMQTTGIAAVHQQRKEHWLPEWRPWPGESVNLAISRPQPASGQTLTLDNTRLKIKPGKRRTDATLELNIRSSKGLLQTLQLPEQAVLQSVMIDGRLQPIRLEGSNLALPVRPGSQNMVINWQQNDALSGYFISPAVAMGLPSINHSITIQLGSDRWVLFTWGPRIGPAVLFWGMLIVFTLLAIGLGKIHVTPLKTWHWFLLLIGLSQIPIASALIVVLWLLVLGIRAQQQPDKAAYFNLLQVALALLTVIAIGLLFVAVQQGLLGQPEMQITGNNSTAANLNWYQDRIGSIPPVATVISVPLTVYRILMLAWSLWLAIALLDWLKWGWQCFAVNGFWKKTKSKKQKKLQVEMQQDEVN